MTDSRTIDLEKLLLLVWFVLNLAIGALTVQEYGLSIDEPNNYRYAKDTLNAYPSFFGTLYEPKYDSSYDGHGPAFVTIAAIPIRIIGAAFPNVFTPDLWHYSYFITFQLTGLCLYWLTKRWFRKWTAWGILVVFGTQPLLLGHAFINPKDVPFMFFVTLSVVLGLRLVDRLETKESFVSLQRPAEILTKKFSEADPRRRRRFLTCLALLLTIVVVFAVFSNQVNYLIEQAITFFYTAEPDSWAGQIFSAFASQASNVSAQDYVTKALRLLDRVERGILILGILFFLVYFGLLIGNTSLPAFLRNLWEQRRRLGESIPRLAGSVRNSLRWSALKTWLAEFLRAFRNRDLIFAGVVLGLATAVRAIAPFAGVMIFLAMFAKLRSRAWAPAIAYFVVAGIVTYLAWPRLWDGPIQRYLEGLGILSNFPHFPGRVLFNGELYGARDLPLFYLPVLLSIQFTEPLVLSVYVGLCILSWRLLRNRLRTDLLLYVGLGFILPLLGLMLLNPTLYHNFRQALFLIPPMFLLAAFTLEWVFRRINKSLARIVLIAMLALPGIYSSAKLFPYEYVYYNSLVGGLGGAPNRYELDYWRISLREVALELNRIAPPGAIIVVTRSAGLFVEYARPDLVVDKVIDSTLDPSYGYDYVVQVARWDRWDLYPEVKNVVTIERDDVALATAKDVRNANRSEISRQVYRQFVLGSVPVYPLPDERRHEQNREISPDLLVRP